MVQPPDAAASILHFARCTVCQRTWETRASFLGDPGLKMIGYQVAFTDLAEGLFLFNHACGTTLALPVGVFQELYDGPIYARRATGSDECPEYCLRGTELRACPAQCECAAVREIIQIILNWPGKAGQQDAPQPPQLIG